MPQYAIKGNLLDITDKTSGYEDFYNPGPWSSVQIDGKVYALPIDAGPMAFFYNKEIFDKAGVDGEKIKTWDDYYEAAKKIHALGDEYYITSDSGDAGFFDSMTWLAGGKPFRTTNNGKDVTINLTGDNGVKEFEKFWQKLLDEKLLDTKTVRMVRGLVQGHAGRHNRIPADRRMDARKSCQFGSGCRRQMARGTDANTEWGESQCGKRRIVAGRAQVLPQGSGSL